MVFTKSGKNGKNVIAISILEELGNVRALNTVESVMDTHRKRGDVVRVCFKQNIWQG